MRLTIRAALTCLLLFLLIVAATAAESAKSLYSKGKIAEARQNYEQAYDFYKQAYAQKPQDLAYRSAFERLRFLAGAPNLHPEPFPLQPAPPTKGPPKLLQTPQPHPST